MTDIVALLNDFEIVELSKKRPLKSLHRYHTYPYRYQSFKLFEYKWGISFVICTFKILGVALW